MKTLFDHAHNVNKIIHTGVWYMYTHGVSEREKLRESDGLVEERRGEETIIIIIIIIIRHHILSLL